MTKKQIEREIAVLAIMLARKQHTDYISLPGDAVCLHTPLEYKEITLATLTRVDILNADAGWKRSANAASPPEGRPGPIGRALGKGKVNDS